MTMFDYFIKPLKTLNPGLESLYVLQMASDKGFLNGKIDYFSVTQARISSISKQSEF